jgi:hypothetical protein
MIANNDVHTKRGPTTVVLTLTPLYGDRWPGPPMRRLAALLKAAQRGYGWTAVSVGGTLGDDIEAEGPLP